MAKLPTDLILEQIKLLRAEGKDMRGEVTQMSGDIGQIKSDLRQVKMTQDRHTLSLDFLEDRVELLREGTLTAISAATNADNGNKKLVSQMAELTRRVEKLEKAK